MTGLSSTVLLTGATGFLGKSLLQHFLLKDKLSVVVAARQLECLPPVLKMHQIDAIDGNTVWTPVFDSHIDIVVHAAARVHVMDESSPDPLEAFRQVNVAGTLCLARAAAVAGVKRFVFVSSVKASGEATLPGHAFAPDAPPAPIDPYGISKLEAEEGLRLLAAETGMEVVIVRPVLIYGPGVGANFLSMMKWLKTGIPLPLGAINNRRSLVSIFNAIDFIDVCTYHPLAANQTFFVSDGEDLSTSELLIRLSKHLGITPRLFSVPTKMLVVTANILKKGAMADRLFASLQVDIDKNFNLLGWRPPITVERSLQMTATSFLESSK